MFCHWQSSQYVAKCTRHTHLIITYYLLDIIYWFETKTLRVFYATWIAHVLWRHKSYGFYRIVTQYPLIHPHNI